jgi:hypothetical protein
VSRGRLHEQDARDPPDGRGQHDGRDADEYLVRRGGRWVLRVPAEDLVARGAVWTFGVAPALVAGVWLVFFAVGGASRVGLAVASGASALAAVPGLVGLALMATARRRAARREVQLDRAERLLILPGREAQVFRTPEAVRVARVAPLDWRLSLRDAEGRETPLLARVPRARGPALAEVAEQLAEALGARAEVPEAARRARSLVPRSARRWAALCYAPLDGVFLAYSLWALVRTRHPEVRFAATQSLVLFAVEGAAALLLFGCLGVPLAALSLPFGARLAGLSCPLAVFAVARVGVRLSAAVRAARGEVWLVPGLAPLLRRRAPTAASRRTVIGGGSW